MAAIGMFDGVHRGHAYLVEQLLRQAKSRGLATAVVTFRQHPLRVLRGVFVGMIMSASRRTEQLHSLGIDEVIMKDFSSKLASLTSLEFLQMLNREHGVTALLVGFNHKFGHDRESSFADYVQYGKQAGVEVIQATEYTADPDGEHISSSAVRIHLASGEVEAATKCLGRYFSLEGIVVHGYKNGRTIGFPTANLGHIDPDVVRPKKGVYVVRTHVENHGTHWGMANVGTRPTIDATNTMLSVEVNIFNFDADIYDRHIEVEFVHFLRPEANLGSLQGLKRQLCQDREDSLKIIEKITTK